MPGVPEYTDPWASEWARMRGTIHAALTAARSRIKFAKLVAAQLLVSSVAGARIIVNPDDAAAGTAQIWLAPPGVLDPDEVTKLSADVVAAYPGQSTFHLTSGRTADSSSEFLVAPGEISMSIHNPDGTGEAGGQAYWGHDLSAFGYIDGSNNNFWRFSPSSISAHIGQWNDYGQPLGSSAGIVPGSVSTPGAVSFYTISYPSVMASNMGPVVTVRRSSANFRWCLTASSTSGFTISLENAAESFAFYFWSFRH